MPNETIHYLDTSGRCVNGYKPALSLDDILKGYRAMLTTRLVDERMITLQRQGQISFAISSLGEEACAVASAAALQLCDWAYPQYREAGVMFWRGFTIEQYVHHMFGDAQDLSFGRQMPNHFGSRALNVVTVSSPIATKIPHAAGCAYAMKLQKEQAVTICYFGEGATSEGDFHAGLNFAAVRKVPAIFFCRNNQYAISTPTKCQFACGCISEKGTSYGIEAFCVDGNDYFAVHDSVAKARQLCLAGKGPVLIEAMTYRMGAHSTSDDPSQYRLETELEEWKEKDPILRLRRYLEHEDVWNDEKETVTTREINDEITQAISIAKQTPKPPLEYMIEHVYATVPEKLKQQYEDLKSL